MSTKPLQLIISALSVGALLLSLLGYVAVTVCLYHSWDSVAAITVFPFWLWAIGGVALCIFARLLRPGKTYRLVALLWVATVFIGSDERHSLMRGLSPSLAPNAPAPVAGIGHKALRVVTINCLDRNVEAVEEVRAFKPDIVFIQEAPTVSQLRKVAKELWGDRGTVIGAYHQCAIMANGKLLRRNPQLRSHGMGARLTTPNGLELELASIHLEHATTRWDLWRKDCWRKHRDLHRQRKSQLKTLFAELEGHRQDGVPAILAGDFNSPPTSNLFDLVPAGYQNAFSEAGKGLGNTFINGFPVLRIDHIYVSRRFEVLDASAARTLHSDHRMVVTDLKIRAKNPNSR